MEFVDVNAGAGGTSVNHEGILHERDVGRMGDSTVNSFEEVWVCFRRGGDEGGLGGW